MCQLLSKIRHLIVNSALRKECCSKLTKYNVKRRLKMPSHFETPFVYSQLLHSPAAISLLPEEGRLGTE